MSKITSWMAGGIKSGYIGYYDSDGFFCAGARSLAAGESAELARWYAIKSMDITVPQDDVETQTGDDQNQGSLTFPSGESVAVGIQTGLSNKDVDANALGINKYDNGQISGTLIKPAVEEYPLCLLMALSTAKEKVFGQAATRAWEHWLLFQGELTVGGPDAIAERQLRNYDYNFTADQVTQWPWGVAMTAANEGATGGAGYHFGDTNRLMMGAFRTGSSNAVTDITLEQTVLGDHTDSRLFKLWEIDLTTKVATELVADTDFEVDDTSNNKIVHGTVASPTAFADNKHFVYTYLW